MKEEIDFNEVYNKIQDLLNNGNATISILEDQIDIDLQVEYFKHSKKVLKKLDKNLALSDKELLLDEETSLDKKKEILSSLAKIDNPEAYRAIELYKETAGEDLIQWSTLALQESKMVLETSLLGKAPIFISTGLGGQGDKLRYFLVLIGKEDKFIEKWQEDLVVKELDYAISEKEGVLEEVIMDHDKFLVTLLLPIKINIKDTLSRVVNECNEFGNFLMNSFIVTNVKKLEKEEIQKMVDNYRGIGMDENLNLNEDESEIE